VRALAGPDDPSISETVNHLSSSSLQFLHGVMPMSPAEYVYAYCLAGSYPTELKLRPTDLSDHPDLPPLMYQLCCVDFPRLFIQFSGWLVHRSTHTEEGTVVTLSVSVLGSRPPRIDVTGQLVVVRLFRSDPIHRGGCPSASAHLCDARDVLTVRRHTNVDTWPPPLLAVEGGLLCRDEVTLACCDDRQMTPWRGPISGQLARDITAFTFRPKDQPSADDADVVVRAGLRVPDNLQRAVKMFLPDIQREAQLTWTPDSGDQYFLSGVNDAIANGDVVRLFAPHLVDVWVLSVSDAADRARIQLLPPPRHQSPPVPGTVRVYGKRHDDCAGVDLTWVLAATLALAQETAQRMDALQP
jgi:hypothetical protein